MKKTRKPTHPGIAFKELVIEPLNLTITETAHHLRVARKTLSEVLNGRSDLSPEMALRWAKLTDTSVGSWYKMQVALDIWKVENTDLAEDVAYLKVG